MGSERKISRKCSCFHISADWRGPLLAEFDWQRHAAAPNAVATKCVLTLTDNQSNSWLCLCAFYHDTEAQNIQSFFQTTSCKDDNEALSVLKLLHCCFMQAWIGVVSPGELFPLPLPFTPRLAHAAPSLPFFTLSVHSVAWCCQKLSYSTGKEGSLIPRMALETQPAGTLLLCCCWRGVIVARQMAI